MSVEINVELVSLPEGFHVDKKEENGGVTFEFSKPVALPYSDDSLARYKAACESISWGRDTSIERSDLTALTNAVVRAILPEYTGNDGFYKPSLEISGMYGFGITTGGDFRLIHMEGDTPRAMVHLLVHSADRFFPAVTEEGVRRPTINKGQMKGSVYVRTNIPHPDGGNYIYRSNVSAAILSALLTESDVSLSGDQRVKTGYEFGNSRVYMQVPDPTLERIQATLSNEDEIARFFAANTDALKVAAKVFTEAQKLDEEYKQKVVAEHRQLLGQVERARKELDPEIPVPASIDDTVARIDTHINVKLREATDVIADLYAKFPRGILKYATPENVEIRRNIFAIG